MSAQPEPKVNELLEKLTTLQGTSNEFALKSIEREANVLMKTDAPDAHMILGIIAGIKGNFEQCINSFSIAIRLIDNDIIRNNYALSLMKLGLPSLAFDQISEALNYSEGDINLYKDAIPIAFLAGHPKKVIEYKSKLEAFKADIDEETQNMINDSIRMLSLDLPDNYFEVVFPVIEKVSLGSKAEIVSTQCFFDLPHSPAIFWIKTRLNVEQTVELNIRFCDILAEKEISPIDSNKFTILFRAAS